MKRFLFAVFLLFCFAVQGAQQIINVGTTNNDGTGDSLRAAFIKANSNFSNIFETLPGGTGAISNGFKATFESFGGIGDGATDNFTAMTNALTQTTTVGGGTILFGPKTYRISQTVPVSNLKSITLEGVGPMRSKIELNLSGGTIAGFNFLTTTNADGVAFKNLAISGANNSDTSPWDLILIGEKWSNFSWVNCLIENARHSAIRWSAVTNGTNFLIDCSWVRGINTSNMTAVDGGAILGSPQGLTIRNSRIDMYGPTNRSTMHAVYLAGAGAGVTNFTITGNAFNGINARLHVYAGASRNGVVTDNQFTSVPGIVVDSVNTVIYARNIHDNSTLKASCDNGLFAGNFFNNGTIQALTANGQVFSGNTFSNQVSTAVFTIDSTAPVVIRGNTAYSGDGININAGAGHLVEQNTIRITSAINGALHLLGSVSNVLSRGNYYYSSGASPYILKNEGTGTNCWSYYDTIDSVGAQLSGFNTPKYPTGAAYP